MKRDGKQTFEITFWDLEAASNPSLKVEVPLAAMWVLSSSTHLGNSWAYASDGEPTVPQEFAALQTKKLKVKADRQAMPPPSTYVPTSASRPTKDAAISEMTGLSGEAMEVSTPARPSPLPTNTGCGPTTTGSKIFARGVAAS